MQEEQEEPAVQEAPVVLVGTQDLEVLVGMQALGGLAELAVQVRISLFFAWPDALGASELLDGKVSQAEACSGHVKVGRTQDVRGLGRDSCNAELTYVPNALERWLIVRGRSSSSGSFPREIELTGCHCCCQVELEALAEQVSPQPLPQSWLHDSFASHPTDINSAL